MKQTTKIVFICFGFLITFIIVNTLLDAGINYFYNKNKDSVKQEIKIEQQEQTLQGMNYNNSEGWYKNCKVKIVHDKFNNMENEINKFISEKDIVDIKVTSSKIIIIYIEPSLSEDIIIEEE